MESTPPSPITLLRRGVFRSRRRYDLSDSFLIRSLYAIGALGFAAGLVLFTHLMIQETGRQDQLRLGDGARLSASKVQRLLDTAEFQMTDAARLTENPSETPLDAERLRDLRRALYAEISGGPLTGLVVFDANGEAILETGTLDGAVTAHNLAQPLEADAVLLSERLLLVASGSGDIFLHFQPAGSTGRRVVGVLDQHGLLGATTPVSDPLLVFQASYLLDGAGRIIIGSGAASKLRHADIPGAPYNATPLGESSAQEIAAISGDGGTHWAASALLASGTLRIVHVGQPQTLFTMLKRSGWLISALLAPAALGLVLLISVIQNEWRKTDRRTSNMADVVARAEIASDLMSAGIVDWCVADSTVVYTKGWRDQFGYSDAVSAEEIYDWIGRIHQDDRHVVRDTYQKMMDGMLTSVDHTFRVLCADGGHASVRERGAVRIGPDGDVARIILVQTPYVQNRSSEKSAA